jgi:lipopolysaccharide biosynthesis protein
MKRLAIFAHYDGHGLIDEHVLYYLRGLQPVTDRTLFISDCDLKLGEAEKLTGLAELVWAGRHGEYDFCSWKRGFAHLGAGIENWDEIVLANDSCYAPVFPFAEVFDRMGRLECDVWGCTATYRKGRISSITSYFLVFRRPVLADQEFRAFWPAVIAELNADAVRVRYEIGLSKLLIARGFRLESVVHTEVGAVTAQGYYVRRLLPAYRLPWLRVKLYRDNELSVMRLGRTLEAIDRLYPRRLIDAHITRFLGTASPRHYHYWLGSFHWPRERFPIQLVGKVKNKRWWKVYLCIFGVRVFGIAVPLFR